MCKKAIESQSSAVVVCAHKEVMLECDLLYGHHDGHGVFGFDGDTLKQWNQASGKLQFWPHPVPTFGVIFEQSGIFKYIS